MLTVSMSVIETVRSISIFLLGCALRAFEQTGWQLTIVHHLDIHPLCTGQPLAENYHSTKDYQCLQNTYRRAISSRRTFFTTFTLYSKKRMPFSLCPSYKEDILCARSTNISMNATEQQFIYLQHCWSFSTTWF